MNYNTLSSSSYSDEDPTELIDMGDIATERFAAIDAATEQFAQPEAATRREGLIARLKGKLSRLTMKAAGIDEPLKSSVEEGYMAYSQAPEPLADLYNNPIESPLAGLARPLSEITTSQSFDEAPTENIQLAGNPEDAYTEVSDISKIEMINRLDRGVAKLAPTLNRQLREGGRENHVTYIKDAQRALHTSTSNSEYSGRREMVTEGDALKQLAQFLEKNSSNPDARSMRENLTFIGEKEYKEAAGGIAEYWKNKLEVEPDLKICALAGLIAKQGGYTESDGKPQIKSDEYLLDNIIGNFSDDELEKYGGRILTNPADIAQGDNVGVVLLDDWTISGSQLKGAYSRLLQTNPQLKGRIEIQLIAASNDRVQNGLKHYSSQGEVSDIPVRAYYLAHDAHDGAADRSGTHITGYHSSVDFDFEDDISYIVASNVKDGRKYTDPVATTMPRGTTNIVRPYRMGNSLTYESRLAGAKARQKVRGVY